MDSKIHVKEPTQAHTHTIIVLHGRDSTADEFASELFESQVSDGRTFPEIFPGMKWVFPDSGKLNSARFGCEMSQWFDMWSVEHPEERIELQIPGLKASVQFILEVIKKEASFVGPEKIFLAGISQGFATLTHVFFSLEAKFAGMIGFCSWLPFEGTISEMAVDNAYSFALRLKRIRSIAGQSDSPNWLVDISTLLFLAHSEDDVVVPIANGKRMKRVLKKLGVSVKWHSYVEGGHWLNEPQGMEDVVVFMKKCME